MMMLNETWVSGILFANKASGSSAALPLKRNPMMMIVVEVCSNGIP